MCVECNQSPCATMCPNGNPTVDEILIECALCGKEVDEETATYGICEKCWSDNKTFENALAHGKEEKISIFVNGFFEKLLSDDQINEALLGAALNMRKEYPAMSRSLVESFISDDDGAFAAFLKEKAHGA